MSPFCDDKDDKKRIYLHFKIIESLMRSVPKIPLMKFILIAASLAISCASQAQIVTKSRFISGTVSSSYSKTLNQSREIFDARLHPEYGKFISEKWSIQGGISYRFHFQKEYYTYIEMIQYQSRTNAFGLNFGVTRYFPLSANFYFTLTGSVMADMSNRKGIEPPTSTSSNYITGIALGPGLNYFINDRWSLIASLGALQFQSSISESNAPDIYAGFTFSSSTAGIGVRYIFKPKMKSVKE